MLSRLRTTYTPLKSNPFSRGMGRWAVGPRSALLQPYICYLAPAHARGRAMSDLINVLLWALMPCWAPAPSLLLTPQPPSRARLLDDDVAPPLELSLALVGGLTRRRLKLELATYRRRVGRPQGAVHQENQPRFHRAGCNRLATVTGVKSRCAPSQSFQSVYRAAMVVRELT